MAHTLTHMCKDDERFPRERTAPVRTLQLINMNASGQTHVNCIKMYAYVQQQPKNHVSIGDMCLRAHRF